MRGGTKSGGASLVEVGGFGLVPGSGWECLGVAGSGWEWPGRGLGLAALLVPGSGWEWLEVAGSGLGGGWGGLLYWRRVGGSTGSSVKHRALVGPALLGGRLLGGFTLRKQGDNGPQGRGDVGRVGVGNLDGVGPVDNRPSTE